MAFKPGESGNPKGKRKGTQNRLTKTVKETVLSVFNDIQSDPKVNLKAFAKNYPRDFYQIAAKLIPTEISGTLNNNNFNYNTDVSRKEMKEINDFLEKDC